MERNKTKDKHILEPIFQITEFELDAEGVLEEAKKEAAALIQEAKAKAERIIQEEKESFAAIEKEYFAGIEKELALEKEKLSRDARVKAEQINNIPEEKIRQAADYILKRIIP